MDNLPFLRCIDSGLGAGTVYINEHFAEEIAASFEGLRKAGLAEKEDWRHSLIIRGLRML